MFYVVSLSSRVETTPDFNASKHMNFGVRKDKTVIKLAGWVWQLTKCLRGIRNAWHFRYALIFVIKVVCGNIGIALLTP